MLKVSHQLATACRRRGVVCGSITCIRKWSNLVWNTSWGNDFSEVDRSTLKHLAQKLEKSDASFKEFHFEVLDLFDEAEQDDEQTILDEHDNKVAYATTCIQ